MVRLERLVASGERMQRMIEQLLDMTRACLAGGIPEKPIRVVLSTHPGAVRLSVHNEGTPIDQAFTHLLFDPFA